MKTNDTGNKSEDYLTICSEYSADSTPDMFIWSLKEDGTGTILDVRYDEKLDISHDIEPDLFAKMKAVTKDKLEEIRLPYARNSSGFAYKIDEHHYLEATEEDKEKSKIQKEVCEKLEDIFWNFVNDSLENPVGKHADDTEGFTQNGNREDLEEALACVYDIVNNNKFDQDRDYRNMYVEFDDQGESMINAPTKLHDLIDCIIETFDYEPGVSYNYVDQNDGRLTSHVESIETLTLGEHQNADLPKTAREVLERCNTLRNILAKYDKEAVTIMEKTFEHDSITHDEV